MVTGSVGESVVRSGKGLVLGSQREDFPVHRQWGSICRWHQEKLPVLQLTTQRSLKRENWGFPGGSGVKNLPANIQVLSLIREDPTCCRATKSVCRNYLAFAREPERHNY